MPSVKLDINQLLKELNLSQEALDNVIEICLRRTCEKIVAEAKTNHPSWSNRTGSLERAIMYQVHKKRKQAYVFIRNSVLAENSSGDKVPYGDYLRFGTGLYGKYHSYIYPRNAKVLAWKGSTGKIIAKKTKGIKGDDWLARARDSIDANKIFREVLKENYGSANIK